MNLWRRYQSNKWHAEEMKARTQIIRRKQEIIDEIKYRESLIGGPDEPQTEVRIEDVHYTDTSLRGGGSVVLAETGDWLAVDISLARQSYWDTGGKELLKLPSLYTPYPGQKVEYLKEKDGSLGRYAWFRMGGGSMEGLSNERDFL